ALATREQICRTLLAKILKIDWPACIIKRMAAAVVAEFADQDNVMDTCKAKLIHIITHRDDRQAVIPLALFYRVKPELGEFESSYVSAFKNSNDCVNSLRSFYEELLGETNGEMLAKNFL
ncbi:MAG: hypothetical protein M3R00_03495, partial [Pseudomonadota bacterium]|nr:hypothetical protein [Pseudomonadota bacterium]